MEALYMDRVIAFIKSMGLRLEMEESLKIRTGPMTVVPTVSTALGIPMFAPEVETALMHWKTITTFTLFNFTDKLPSIIIFVVFRLGFLRFIPAALCALTLNFKEARWMFFNWPSENTMAEMPLHIGFLLLSVIFIPYKWRQYLTNGWLTQERVWRFLTLLILLTLLYQFYISSVFDESGVMHSHYTRDEIIAGSFGLNFSIDSYVTHSPYCHCHCRASTFSPDSDCCVC
jgi:hypothetical protein